MEPVFIAIFSCLGVAAVVTSVCVFLDWRGEIVYKSTTLAWYFVAAGLCLVALLIFLYHISGIQIGFSWASN